MNPCIRNTSWGDLHTNAIERQNGVRIVTMVIVVKVVVVAGPTILKTDVFAKSVILGGRSRV